LPSLIVDKQYVKKLRYPKTYPIISIWKSNTHLYALKSEDDIFSLLPFSGKQGINAFAYVSPAVDLKQHAYF
jgi:hypothetical protein